MIFFDKVERWEKAEKLGWKIVPTKIDEKTLYLINPPIHFACRRWGRTYKTIPIDEKATFAIPTWYFDDYIMEHGKNQDE